MSVDDDTPRDPAGAAFSPDIDEAENPHPRSLVDAGTVTDDWLPDRAWKRRCDCGELAPATADYCPSCGEPMGADR